MPLSMLAISPGASHATGDVYQGIVTALQAEGHTIYHYPLGRALGLAETYLKVLKRGNFIEKLDQDGLQYMAGVFALDRALHYNVDWVFIVAGQLFHIDFFIKLKLAGRKIALLLTESPYEFEHEWERCKFADVVFTSERKTAAILRKVHPSAHYLPHAYNPARHRPDAPDDEPEVLSHDVVFVGTGWPERIKLFEAVNWDGIDFGLYGIHWARRISKRSPLRAFLSEGPIPNEQAAALYRQAKIGINLHRTAKGYGMVVDHIAPEEAESMNPRAYELAASGLFYLSDPRAEVEEVFRGNVPIFHSAAELETLIRRYLADPNARTAISTYLPSHVQGQTFAARARFITAQLEAVRACQEVVPV